MGQLSDAGHEVRAVVADSARDTRVNVRTIVCAPSAFDADLPYEIPLLAAPRRSARSFLALSSTQLAAYREALRGVLDEELGGFDPEIVHVQHLWLDGHLVLESGAPYVVSAFADELDAADADSRYLRYVQETAENAGRILVEDPRLERVLTERFDLPREHFAPGDVSLEKLLEIYRAVSDARFGRA